MFFGLLGALVVGADDGAEIPLGGRRARSLLALLLLDAGRMVPASRLVDGVYGDALLGRARELYGRLGAVADLERVSDR